jgi:uncharacterized protein (DUF1697 family)
MNLGRRRVTNEQLVACLSDGGLPGAEAFLASGNLVVEARGSTPAVAKKVARILSDGLGYDVPTFVRAGSRLLELASAEPFAPRRHTGVGKPQIAFLPGPAPAAATRAIRALATDDDWLALDDDVLHWWPRSGVALSELDFRAVERHLGPVTVRTRGTIERMATKYFAPSTKRGV